MDLLDLYERGSAWTAEKIKGAVGNLDAPTRCDEWSVRAVINHLLHGHQIFQGAARGEPISPPQGAPPEVMGDDPAGEFESGRQATVEAFRQGDAAEKYGQALGIAFADTIIHGSDIAQATGQDATIPPDLAEAAKGMVGGLPAEGVPGLFKARVDVGDDASASDKLLAHVGRTP
jgi:uncharacterized protein (TIGR03086 family)